ncbi:hypothetical protein YSY43_22030 [Paenibacillus sp. YSY-4.3]
MKDSVGFIIKANRLFDYYDKELSLYSLLSKKIKTKIKGFLLCFLIMCVLTLALPAFDVLYIFIFLLVPLGVSFWGRKLVQSISKHLKENFPEYAPLLKDKIIDFDKEFIAAYKCNMLAIKLREPGINIEGRDLNTLIEYYEEQGNHTFSTLWWPISFFLVIVFPLWENLIGKVYDLNESIGLIILLLVILVSLLSFLSLLFKGLIDMFYLSKANKYKGIAKTLKLIKLMYVEE